MHRSWAENAVLEVDLALDRRGILEATGNELVDSPDVAVAREQVRWALWCVDSPRELRVLADVTDARGRNETPQGFPALASATGHPMWACTTAMGALDRAAAAFGAITLGVKENGTVHDFDGLYEKRRQVKNAAVRAWLKAVHDDPAYRDAVSLLRHPMVHRTTPMAHYARSGSQPSYEETPAHEDAPGFYVPALDRDPKSCTTGP